MLALTLALALSQQNPQRKPSLTGHIEPPLTIESKILHNKRDILVYLPPQYEKEPKRRFPVLYMHDGQNVFDGATSFIPNQEWRADESAEALIDAKLIEPIIIVAIPNAGADRANEYLPTQLKDQRGNPYGGNAANYGRMLTEEIKPEIDRRYRTKKGANDTGLAGSSYGGIVTLYLGLERPTVFGKLGVFSPSLNWNDQEMTKRVEALPAKLPLKIWLDMGGGESGNGEFDAQLTAMARKLDGIFQRKGWTEGKDLAYYQDGYAPHNEISWSRRFPAMLMFLFPAKR